MTRPAKLLIIAAVVVVFAPFGYVAVSRIMFGWSLSNVARRQHAQIEEMRPAFNSMVSQKLKIGQPFEDAQKILRDAGLSVLMNDEESPGKLTSFYPANHVERGPGFAIELKFDNQNKVSKIDIQEVTDMP